MALAEVAGACQNIPQNVTADLLKQLKAHCGAGRALRDDRLEIQGDQRGKVQAFLEQQGF